MKIRLVTMGALAICLLVGMSAAVVAKEPPVAKLVQVEGNVEYSRNGVNWNPVRRTKYLFAGYRIRTGKDGSGKLINQNTGESQDLGPNSEIEVKDAEIQLLAGNLSAPESEATSIWQGLANKFAKAQRYTTVRRSVTASDESMCDNKVRTIDEITLSEQYPDLVWRNACPEYSYRLVIDDEQVIEVPAQATAEMIRFTLSDIKTGKHAYRVEVLDKDGTVYIPRDNSTFTWLSNSDMKKISKQAEELEEDVFVMADYLESNGLAVAAMDAYRQYFAEFPDDNDMRPLLIQSYQNLKLTNLRESEARLFNAALEGDF